MQTSIFVWVPETQSVSNNYITNIVFVVYYVY